MHVSGPTIILTSKPEGTWALHGLIEPLDRQVEIVAEGLSLSFC